MTVTNEFTKWPGNSHNNVIKRIFHFIKSITDLNLSLKENFTLGICVFLCFPLPPKTTTSLQNVISLNSLKHQFDFKGCRVKDHIITLPEGSEGDSIKNSKSPAQKLYEDLLARKDAIGIPYQRLSDARYVHISFICYSSCHWFEDGTGIELFPTHLEQWSLFFSLSGRYHHEVHKSRLKH